MLWNADNNRSLEALCEEQPDVLLVCSSILSTESVVRAIPLAKLRPDTIVADVLSVKQFPRNLLLEVLTTATNLQHKLYLPLMITPVPILFLLKAAVSS